MLHGIRQRFNAKSYTLVTAPATEPVSLDELKLFLKIDGTAEDDVLSILIASARRQAEEYTKRAFITQTWALTMDGFGELDINVRALGYNCPPPCFADGSREIRLSRQPIQSVSNIKTTDTSNTQTTVDSAIYTLDTSGGNILLNDGESWPTELRDFASVRIEFVAGYGATDVPEPIRQAILQYAATMYENRKCSDMPEGVKTLLDPFRLAEAFGV